MRLLEQPDFEMCVTGRLPMQEHKPRHHGQLKVWTCGIDLAKSVYRYASQLPLQERYGLTAQLRRAATSIPANIAEGAARGSTREFARFISISQGSLAELETHLVLAHELYELPQDESLMRDIVILRRMLIRLRESLVRRILNG
jgi:four helix bundle protein